MRLAHLADLHLGFRQYTRQTARGLNQREADVAEATRRAIDDVIEQQPDLIVVAGDVFHSVRPTNTAIVFAFRELRRLRDALPDTPVILAAGNHDTPRSVETGSILRLFEALGVLVADDAPRRFEFPALGTSVLAVPHQALVRGARPALRPEGDAPIQILVTHGEVEGALPEERAAVEYGGAQLAVADLAPDAWSYVALGHYHVPHAVRPNAWYAGSLDFVGTVPWVEIATAQTPGGRSRARGREAAHEKGYLLVDLPGGTPELRRVGPVREHVDLEPLRCDGLDAATLNVLIAERVDNAEPPIDDRVVRLVLWDVPRHVVRDLDHARLRSWKDRALHFHLDARRPPPQRSVGVGGIATPRQTLPQIVRAYLSQRPLDADLDREAFLGLGVTYLDEALREEDEPR